jgi:hypothetical protein
MVTMKKCERKYRKTDTLVYLVFNCKECARPECDCECPAEVGGDPERGQCVSATRVVAPSSAASVVTEVTLPDAIAPSLPVTPDFARRNTSWCHAIEVGEMLYGMLNTVFNLVPYGSLY